MTDRIARHPPRAAVNFLGGAADARAVRPCSARAAARRREHLTGGWCVAAADRGGVRRSCRSSSGVATRPGAPRPRAYGLVAGTDYTDKFGGNDISYTYINNDDQALQKATSDNSFDLMHPCAETFHDYVDRGLVQPFDTELLASFGELNPYLVEAGQVDGKQYMIPWDWGYGSLHLPHRPWSTRRTPRAGSWPGTRSTRTRSRSGAVHRPTSRSPGCCSASRTSTTRPTTRSSRPRQKLIEQKPLNKFYWDSEYGQMRPAFKSGTIWITYSWQAAYAILRRQGHGRRATWSRRRVGCRGCAGSLLGANTENYYHAHEYVESFINQQGLGGPGQPVLLRCRQHRRSTSTTSRTRRSSTR